ncbi:MAG: GxxExxY protein [Candidatus Neomarinimicrobiota bacterium]
MNQEALAIEFNNQHIHYEREKALTIKYKGAELDKKYISDFVCYSKIVVETKAVKEICDDHRAQIINYLKVTGYNLGILVNFGESSLKFERFINEKEKRVTTNPEESGQVPADLAN